MFGRVCALREALADERARTETLRQQVAEARQECESWRWAAKQAMGSHDDVLVRRTRERDDAMRNLRLTEDQLGASRARATRYRHAWLSARRRAGAYGEGILRHVGELETYAGWLQQERAASAQLRARLDQPEVAR